MADLLLKMMASGVPTRYLMDRPETLHFSKALLDLKEMGMAVGSCRDVECSQRSSAYAHLKATT